MSSSTVPPGVVHPALLLLGLGQPASPEDPAEGAAVQTASSPAEPAYLLLGLHQASDRSTVHSGRPLAAGPTSASEDPA